MEQIFIGVDSHRSTLAAAAIDPIGRVLATVEVDNDPKGHECLLDWRHQLKGTVRIGIESSGNYGRRTFRGS
jgi:predicted NBD/HSP70 family sugar kinase